MFYSLSLSSSSSSSPSSSHLILLHIIFKSMLSSFLSVLLLFRYPYIMCNMRIYLTIRFVCKCFFNVSIIKNLYLIYPFLLYVYLLFIPGMNAWLAVWIRMDGWLTEWYVYPFKIIQNSAWKRSMRYFGAFPLHWEKIFLREKKRNFPRWQQIFFLFESWFYMAECTKCCCHFRINKFSTIFSRIRPFNFEFHTAIFSPPPPESQRS